MLDLTETSPTNADDPLALRKRTHRAFIDRIKQSRQEMLRGLYENGLFYIGLHWVAPMPDGRGFMRANLRRDVPRPVTNRYKAILDAIDAPISRLDPQVTFVPGSTKDVDRLTASTANQTFDYLSELVQVARFKGELSKILVVCNNAYAHVGWDMNGGAQQRVPRWACPSCGSESMRADEAQDAGGACPTCQTPLKPNQQDADVITEGQEYLEALTPFETWLDYAIPRTADQPVMMVRRLRTKAWAQSMWPEHSEAIRKLAGCSATDDVGLTYLQSLIRLAPGAGGSVGAIGFGAAVRWDEALLDDVLYVKPCTDYPDGLYLRMLGEQLVVEDLTLSAVAHEGTVEDPGKPFIPLIHYGYDNIPGTHMHTGPADQLKDLQRQRNRREAAIELYFQRMANGIWLIPEGTDVQTPSGEEGWVMRYSPLGGSGAKPERVEGNRLPTSYVDWLEFTDKQMEDIAGTYDIFRGAKPPNVSSGYAMQLLTERAQSRFAHVFANYETAHADLARAMFLVFRNNMPETIYHKIKGEEARWQVREIQRADLRGGIDIRAEAGSARPKTILEKKAAVEQLISYGVIDFTDPDVRLRLFNLYGVPEMMASAAADDEQIAREHATLIAWAQSMTDPATGEPYENLTPEQVMLPVLVDALLDLHPLHRMRHRTFMLTPEFLALPDWVRQAFRDGHYVEHMYYEQMDAMQQAAVAAPPAQLGPPGSPGQPQGGGQPGGTADPGAARAQGQATSMQNGKGVPGPRGAQQGAPMGPA